jgi:hypothetical protein
MAVAGSLGSPGGTIVKQLILAIASVAVLSVLASVAEARPVQPSLEQLQADQLRMQAQIQALITRLDGLETANTELRGENAGLKQELANVDARRDAEIDGLKAQTGDLREQGAVASAEIDKLKGADWASRIRFKGDLRVRNETIQSERVVGSDETAEVADAADRDRMRFRARMSAEARVTDSTRVVLGLASGEGDPRSTNQTFTDTSSGKGVYIDLAYADWAFAPGAHLVLGKQKQPYWRTGQSLFFDSDINPEGGAVTFERGAFFGSAYAWWLQEGYDKNPSGNNEDANIIGAQAGFKFPLLSGETRVAAHYYDCGACQYNNPFWSGGNAYGNTTVTQGSGSSAVEVLRHDYNVVAMSGEVNTTLFGLPWQVWGDWARNLASGVRYDTAWSIGTFLGKASGPGTWEAGLMYQVMGKDAMFAQLIDSDFAAGNTDGDGWALRAGYAPTRNIGLYATYMLNSLYQDVAPVSGPGYEIGRNLDYDRLQLDVVYRFQ